MSSTLSGRDIQLLVQRLGRRAVRDVLAPLQENEREKQRQLKSELDRLKPGSKDSSLQSQEDGLEEAETEEADSKPNKVVSQKLATGKPKPQAPRAVIPDPSDIKDVTFDQVVTLLNMMRSGRSAKNPSTKQSLQSYFKGLNSGERQALFVLLSGLTQIIAGGVEGDAAPDPAEVGIKIKPRSADSDTRAPTPGVRRDPALSKPSKEDASAEPVPIVVGESADRSRERRVLDSLRGDGK